MKDLKKALKRLSFKHLEVLHRVAKTRARAFFKDPKAMILLREELERKRSRD